MSDPRPLITSDFSIDDVDLDPDECTRAISIEPTEIGLVGQKLRAESIVKLQTSFWSISIEKERCDNIEDGIIRILDILWPNRERVLEFLKSTGYDAGFGSSVTIYEDRPLYCLSSQTMKRMAYFDVDYCLDIFDYSD